MVTHIPSSAVWRAIRGTGEDVRGLTGDTERLPPSDPRFIVSIEFVYTSSRRSCHFTALCGTTVRNDKRFHGTGCCLEGDTLSLVGVGAPKL